MDSIHPNDRRAALAFAIGATERQAPSVTRDLNLHTLKSLRDTPALDLCHPNDVIAALEFPLREAERPSGDPLRSLNLLVLRSLKDMAAKAVR